MNQPQGYPGLWVTITHRFGPRRPEWFQSIHMLIWGLVLTQNDKLFSQPSFQGFAEIFPSEYFLGSLMLFVATARLIGLIINGTRPQVTPTIRQAGAAVGIIVWGGITYGYFISGSWSTWLAIYPLFIIIEFDNLYRAAHDQGGIRNAQGT